MADGDLASADGPGRRKESWSLKTIVENVSGRPIAEFQDPSRPVHPYLKVKLDHAAAARAHSAALAESEPDPVDRVYPPLTGATGRQLHGPEHEHHPETLHALKADPDEPSPGVRPHAPGPSSRPERIYLHYLLLHMDRLTDHALAYLQRAVSEELEHRQKPPQLPDSTPPPSA